VIVAQATAGSSAAGGAAAGGMSTTALVVAGVAVAAAASSGSSSSSPAATAAPTAAPTSAPTPAPTAAPATFGLTTNQDLLTAGAGNDTIYANTDGSLSNADVIDGGSGTDTLFSVQDTTAAETLSPTMTGIEKLYVDVNDGTAGTAATYTVSGANATGLTEVWAKDFSGSTSGQEDTFAITNVSTAVATGIKGGDGEFHVTTTYLSVTGTADSATLAVEAANVDTVTMAGIETVNIRVDGAASTSTSATVATTIATLTVASATALNITGARNLTITNSIDFADNANVSANDAVIDASTFTGNLTLVSSGGDQILFKGGSGKNVITTGAGNDNLTGGAADDTFTVGAGNDTVVLGAGNDTVIIGYSDINSLDSFDFGDGTRDTLRMAATTLDSSGVGSLTTINKMAGLEVIATSGAVTAIDASYFNQTVFQATAALSAALTVSNVDGDTLIISTSSSVAGDAITATGASAGNTFNLELKGAAAVTVYATDAADAQSALVVSGGISSVNIASDTTSATSVTNIMGITNGGQTTADYAIDNVSASNFTLTGATNLTISGGQVATFSNAVNFDASAFTGKLVIEGSASSDVLKGGTKADTLDGGDGNDTLTGGAGSDTFVFYSTDTTGAASATVLETITDYEKGVDVIDWDNALTIDTATATATSTVAQVNAFGIANFHADDDTLAERIVAAAKGFDADGDFAVFEFSGSTYVLISGDANTSQNAEDTLIKLTGVTGITSATVDANNNIVLA